MQVCDSEYGETDDEILELAEETVVFMMSCFIHFKRLYKTLVGFA